MITDLSTRTNQSGQRHCAGPSVSDRSREQVLVAAAQAGRTDAMDELLARHKVAMYRAARRFTRNHEDAEDLVQDAMFRAFVNVRKFREECHFATWLIAIVNNAGRSMKRRGKNIHFVSLESPHQETAGPSRWDVADVRPDPEEDATRRELLLFLHRVLLRQSRTHQIILERCVFEEGRIADAAASLGVTIGSAKSSLYRARRRVSDSFERRGLMKKRNFQTMPGAAIRRLKNAESL
jgi:RNA polymerase sigma-70 factor (ECF subfamily)